jgi:hypothetical protein
MPTPERYMMLALLNIFEAGALVINLRLRGVVAGDADCKLVQHKLTLATAALNGAPYQPPADQKD